MPINYHCPAPILSNSEASGKRKHNEESRQQRPKRLIIFSTRGSLINLGSEKSMPEGKAVYTASAKAGH